MLMFNLSLSSQRERVIELFCEDVSEIFKPYQIEYSDIAVKDAVFQEEIITQNSVYGYITSDHILDDNQHRLLQGSIHMLGVILERIAFETKLAEKKRDLSSASDDPSKQIADYVRELEQAKQASSILIDKLRLEISKKEKAQKDLLASEEKYRSIFENIEDTYYEVTLEGEILELSPSIKELSEGQYTREALLGKKLSDLYSNPEDRSAFLAELKKKGRVTDYEVNLRNKDGSVRPCAISARLQFDKNGQAYRIIGSMRDISARKDTEQKLRSVIENSSNVFYSHNTDHTITYISPQVVEILGYSQEEAAINWTQFATDHIANENGFRQTMKAIETGKRQAPYELELYKKNGEKIWVEVREAPIVIDGAVHSISGSLTDITERKKAEAQLMESEEKYSLAMQATNDGIFDWNLLTNEI